MDDRIKLDPITRFVRELPEPYWLLREAAAILGVTRNRLRALARIDPDRLGPGHCTWMGQVMIYLYDEDDLTELRAYFTHQRSLRPPRLDPNNAGRGRPPVWSDDEQEDRHRRQSQVIYHRGRAEECERAGRHERAAKHRARYRTIAEGLHSQLATRKSELSG